MKAIEIILLVKTLPYISEEVSFSLKSLKNIYMNYRKNLLFKTSKTIIDKLYETNRHKII